MVYALLVVITISGINLCLSIVNYITTGIAAKKLEKKVLYRLNVLYRLAEEAGENRYNAIHKPLGGEGEKT